ncbi:MAG TPA: hypothetical protein VL860_02905, partial [Planctomycetota bacterium]|nr:hypothetical protein [Planctomycetota bacterium]
VYRHMHTQYSQRPNALWLDYVLPVATEQTVKATAKDGKLTVQAGNFRLTALVAVPAAQEADFKKLCTELTAQRQKLFYAARVEDSHPAIAKQNGDGAYLLWLPDFVSASSGTGEGKPDSLRKILPWSLPSASERITPGLDWKAAQGERAVGRVCVTAFEDLGAGDITLSDLTGPAGTIAAANLRSYFQNYRVQDSSVVQAGLLPWTKIHFEPNLTWAYWLWLHIPDDAKAGDYKGAITFTPEKGGAKTLPVTLTVYPFHYDDNIPLSYGMYFMPMPFPTFVDRRAKWKEQFQFMRELGLTATEINAAHVTGLNGPDKVVMGFDAEQFDLARQAGLGRSPGQQMLSENDLLGFARQIGRLMGFGKEVDQQPGIEFTREKELKVFYQDAVRQYRDLLKKTGLPMASAVVDEPREVPNPWNRNREQSIKYSDWVREVGGLATFIDFASDATHTPKGDDLDLVPVLGHIDIASVHAYTSGKRMIAETQKTGQPLWIYNTGRDRLSWGFYAWRMNAKGRWEWHWFFTGDITTPQGYPTPEDWYSPFAFNSSNAVTPAPPERYPGGITFDASLLDLSMGITDRAYIHMLEQALAAAEKNPAKAATVTEAKAFLEAVRKAIPDLPAVKGLASADAGALVGEGLNSTAAGLCEAWRRKTAQFILALK